MTQLPARKPLARPASRRKLCLRATAGFILTGVLLSSASHAQDAFAPPLPMNNRTPLTQTQIAPAAPDHSLATASFQFGLQTDLSSHSVIQSGDDAQLELDGETWRVGLDLQYRATDRWIFGFKMPVVVHSGGFLDGFIDRWHRITGLPEGERPRQPQDALLIGYRDDNELLLIDREQMALGDIQLSAAFRLRGLSTEHLTEANGWQSQLWSQLTVKLPTGRPGALSGSGAADAALSFHYLREQHNARRPWAFSADAYVMVTGDGEIIEQQRGSQWQFAAKLARNWTTTLTPEVQIRYRSATYNNPLDALGKHSLGIDAGVVLRRARGYWRLGLSEDLKVDSAPDVGFYLQFHQRVPLR